MKPKTVEKAVKILDQIKVLDKLIINIESMAMEIASNDLVPIVEIKLREPQPKQGEFKMRDTSETTFGMESKVYIAPVGSFNFPELVKDYMQQRIGSMLNIYSTQNPEVYQQKDLSVTMHPSNTLEILGVILREKIQERAILLDQLDNL
jgi:hypothetical protein